MRGQRMLSYEKFEPDSPLARQISTLTLRPPCGATFLQNVHQIERKFQQR
jgi:hypothetical protein